MAPWVEGPMRTSSLTMLDHSLSAWSAKETRQAQERVPRIANWDWFDYQVSDGGGHKFLCRTSDLVCRGSFLLERGLSRCIGRPDELPLADSPHALPADGSCPWDCLGLPFGTVLDFALKKPLYLRLKYKVG